MLLHPNAKLNIGLNIVERRPDGYHNIETIFYPIPLCDTLEVCKNEGVEDYRLDCGGLVIDASPEDNLLIKAYRAMQRTYGVRGVDIRFEKGIPFGAGLGGGSADAAFMLRTLNEEFNLGASSEELRAIASTIGADCPFFIDNIPTYAEGIGDVFSPVKIDLSGYHLLLVKPNVHVSTPAAYRGVTPQRPGRNLREVIEREPIKEWKHWVVNDFEKSVFAQFPELGEIKQLLYERGALYAAMSGSGSTLYGLFDKEPSCDGFGDAFTFCAALK